MIVIIVEYHFEGKISFVDQFEYEFYQIMYLFALLQKGILLRIVFLKSITFSLRHHILLFHSCDSSEGSFDYSIIFFQLAFCCECPGVAPMTA